MGKLVALLSALLVGCAPLVVPPFMGSPSSSSTPKLGAYQGLQFSGDISGNYVAQTNVGLQGRAVASSAPTSGQALEWSGTAWTPTTVAIGPPTFTPGTADQLLDTNHGATTAEWFTLGGDGAFASHNLSIQSITPTGGTSTIVPFNAGGLKLATTPFVWQDSGAVQRFSLETAHGRGTFGGGGSDYRSIVGPLVGSETSFSALWLLDNGTAASGSNSTLNQGGGVLNLNALSTGNIQFTNVGGATFEYLTNGGTFYWGGATGTAPLQFTGAFSTTPAIQSGTSATSLTIGPNKAGAGLLLQTDAAANILQLYGGTQAALALGANFASQGHFRFPQQFNAFTRNSGNTGDKKLLVDDGLDNVNLCSDTYASCTIGASAPSSSPTQVFILGNGTIALESTADLYEDATTIHVRNASHTQYLTVIPAAAAQVNFDATNATSGAVQWNGAATGAGNNLSVIGQAAGGASADGGNIVLTGGTHAGSKADGSVQVTTPFNAGYVAIAAATTISATNAQSNANVINITGTFSGAIALNLLREIADTSLVVIRNSTTNGTITVSYLTGGTVGSITPSTSVLIASDGANLQAIMHGT